MHRTELEPGRRRSSRCISDLTSSSCVGCKRSINLSQGATSFSSAFTRHSLSSLVFFRSVAVLSASTPKHSSFTPLAPNFSIIYKMPMLARRFSITNFLIASSALGFQVFVLYPWHNKLDDDFHELKQENIRLVQRIESMISGNRLERLPRKPEMEVEKGAILAATAKAA